jgi:hypothetical protein
LSWASVDKIENQYLITTASTPKRELVPMETEKGYYY